MSKILVIGVGGAGRETVKHMKGTKLSHIAIMEEYLKKIK